MQGPWLIGGDFNNVLNLNERLGSTVTLDEVIEFRSCIRECGVSDHKSSGPFYTWSKLARPLILDLEQTQPSASFLNVYHPNKFPLVLLQALDIKVQRL